MELRSRIRKFTQQLRRDYTKEISSDSRAFKKYVIRLLKINLPPFPGRPPEQAISLAIELRRLGQTWKEIYPKVIANHAGVEPNRRQHEEINLRAAVRSRENASLRKREKKRAHVKGGAF